MDTSRARLASYIYGIISFGSALIVATLLFVFIGSNSQIVLGFTGFAPFIIMPFVVAAISSFCAYMYFSKKVDNNISIASGIIISVITFLLINLILSIYAAGMEFYIIIIGFIFFSSVFFGWLVLVSGVIVTLAIKRCIK